MPCGSPAEFHVHAVHIAEHALREDVLDSALCVQLLFVQDDDLICGGCEQIQIVQDDNARRMYNLSATIVEIKE